MLPVSLVDDLHGQGGLMSEQPKLVPTGISRAQFAALTDYSYRASEFDVERLRRIVARHLEDARIAHSKNRLVNVRLATAICDVIHHVFDHWEELQLGPRGWLGGAILYFATCNDDEHDFTSSLGFEDDAEILNACLKHAGMADLCITIEDFDDA